MITHPFSLADRGHPLPLPRDRPGSPTTPPRHFSGQRCRSKQDRAFSPIVLLGDLPLTYPYTAAPAAGSNIPERHSANGGGRSEGRRPRAAGYVRGRAPDKMTGIRQDASSPAALAQRQKVPGQAGHEGKHRAAKWLYITDIPKTNRPK